MNQRRLHRAVLTLGGDVFGTDTPAEKEEYVSPGLVVVTELISTGLPGEKDNRLLWSSSRTPVRERLPNGG